MEIQLPSPVSEQEISRDTLLEKYAKGGEQSVTEVRRRVARALAQVEREGERVQWERRFLQAQ
jgi:ribonucleoside-diphosphate reductase alpha chain